MTGKRVWWYFFAFFVFIATVNAVMVTLAIRTHSGVVTDHPYEKGLAYNKVVDAENKQEELGWIGKIDYEDGSLSFTLSDKNNQPLKPEKITANFYRPAKEGKDFSVDISSGSKKIDFPEKGNWEVRIDAENNGVHFQTSKRIVVE